MSSLWSERTSAARSSRHAVGLLVVALAASAALGCSSSSTDTASTGSSAPTSSVTGATAAGPGTTEAGGRCVSRMPGEILTADEAVVHFSPSQVCPGYVTVAPGTPVSFVNEDTQAHTITITEGNLPDGAVVTTTSVATGETWVQTFDAVGTFSYVTDAIPTFRGAIEVTTGDTAH